MSDEVFDNDYSDFSHDTDSTDSSGLFAGPLRAVMDRIDVSNSLTTPIKDAIDQILQLAAEAVGSEIASVLVRDGNEGGLKFLTAISDGQGRITEASHSTRERYRRPGFRKRPADGSLRRFK